MLRRKSLRFDDPCIRFDDKCPPYGFSVGGGTFTGTPYAGLDLSESSRVWRLGTERRSGVDVERNLEGTHSESAVEVVIGITVERVIGITGMRSKVAVTDPRTSTRLWGRNNCRRLKRDPIAVLRARVWILRSSRNETVLWQPRPLGIWPDYRIP